jgi:serine/threonine-protein kinase RsbW
MNDKPTNRMAVTAHPANLERMLRFVEESAIETGAGKDHLNEVLLACQEALVNIVSYAYPQGRGEVEIIPTLMLDPRRLVVQISDAGVAFNPLAWPDPDVTIPLEERPLGGLGIFLMRRIMDHVRYRREMDRNVLILEKRLEPVG